MVVQVLEIYCEFGASHTAMSTIALWSPYSPEPRRLDELNRIEVRTTSPWFCVLLILRVVSSWGDLVRCSSPPLSRRLVWVLGGSSPVFFETSEISRSLRTKRVVEVGAPEKGDQALNPPLRIPNDDPTCFFFLVLKRGMEQKSQESSEPSWI